MTTRVRKSRLHTALSAAIDINIKSCISDWCKNQFAGWFGTLPLFPNPNLGFHFQKCSREIFMERAHTHTHIRSLAPLTLFLSRAISSQVSRMPVVRTFFLLLFYNEHKILLNCNKKWHIYKYCYGFLRHLSASAHTRWKIKEDEREKKKAATATTTTTRLISRN